jgi:hypothetical protein
MKQKSKSIHEFKPGDIITRIEPVVKISKAMFMGGVDYDGSFIGEKLIFVGIANGCAYFETTDSFSKTLEKGGLISLKIYNFEKGWSYYIDPVTLLNMRPRSEYEALSNKALIDKLDNAISDENYEEASKIQHEIDKREL